MRSSNPVLRTLTDTDRRSGDTLRGTMQQGYPSAPAPTQMDQQRPMTVDDVVTKTGITLAVIIALGAATFVTGMYNPGIAMILTGIGAIGGFITVLVSTFGRKFGSAVVTLLYAAFEGLFVGGFSFVFANVSFGQGANQSSGMAIVGQAIVGTVGVFLGMLFVYKSGAVRVTPKFNRIVTGAIVGVAVLTLINLIAAVFFNYNPLRDGGTLAIIFSLVCIVLAALSFLQDFDLADGMIRAGAPANQAWGVALGLSVTLVWLYTEILRLLSYMRNS
ncbi:Bax inhibitor-1/YccA family protein [Corynebacterium uberis]|uniref:Bax inhibitor-1/YccA family protein n=1 Tax=Corynebacterium TaxID=1716 RepID=UPI001D0A8078|nr:Bax inhibitor-1/YccA family protein [Corynebacterium uberis]MCZ9308874.1 Bax inhibitor-1/YccA family protein [Corynebacterium sp. c6VSa_13]UDL74648.1 Bax inhibitor-1/YccA family protein [Corynebacterium uberis]UDL76518.1 Bax inhibitor-1/YccA family protein [Corynebacterium uberis]UDL78730.1 Bax inhibitor-1/YccA family protein [Corynebacterium uberis]UDL81009.1 Bax inhibitor-1/YccA family protein [Corynebacterium uberis]